MTSAPGDAPHGFVPVTTTSDIDPTNHPSRGRD